jgi:hypothetical protein
MYVHVYEKVLEVKDKKEVLQVLQQICLHM